METIKEKTVCFTGHRPEKLPGGSYAGDIRLNMIKSTLYYQIQLAIEQGFEFFINGLARGVDIWAAQYVIELRRQYPDIKLISVMPFRNHSKGFKGKDLYDLNLVINNSDEVICVSDEFSKDCYRRRNYYMVDNSSRLIAVVENFRSGTGQTINYARKKGIDVKMINVTDFTKKINGENG